MTVSNSVINMDPQQQKFKDFPIADLWLKKGDPSGGICDEAEEVAVANVEVSHLSHTFPVIRSIFNTRKRYIPYLNQYNLTVSLYREEPVQLRRRKQNPACLKKKNQKMELRQEYLRMARTVREGKDCQRGLKYECE